MKSNALLCAVLVLLSAACASNDGFVADRVNACKEGEKVSLRAGISQQSRPGERIPGQLDVMVEVAKRSPSTTYASSRCRWTTTAHTRSAAASPTTTA
jgi:hypothetical protein